MNSLWKSILPVAAMALATGCSSEEPEDHDTPTAAKLYGPGSQELTPNVALARGQTIRIEVRFYADDGDQITGLEDEHATALTFSPATLATAGSVSGQPFFFDVVAQNAAGTGTVSVGFGHGSNTTEKTFGPFPVAIP